MNLLSSFLAAFIPIFVAMDAVGTLPFYVSMVDGMKERARRRLLVQAIFTAAAVGIGFILLGKLVFSFLGITIPDFKIAGGLLLLILAITELLFPGRAHGKTGESISPGVVPLGVPLIVGPAVLTALVMQADQVGVPMTLAAFGISLFLTLVIFRADRPIERLLGKAGAQAVSKVANVLLAAYGVMTVRVGIFETLARGF